MIHFYDTNVVIGYIYSIDPLNKASKKAISKSNGNYYSEHVKTEVNKVTFRKDREYDKFLRKISNILKKTNDNSLIDLSRIHAEINKFKAIGELNVKNMHLAIDIIWQELGFSQNTDAYQVKTDFNNYLNKFQAKHRKYKKYCFKKMKYIPAYHKKDKTVLNKIKEKSLREKCLHSRDEEILFDVNDYIKNNPNLDLLFVSGDEDFIKAISLLIDVLNFNKYIYLKDYLKN